MSTYNPIASQTLTSGAASVTFTNIPQNYTDIVIIATGAVNTESTLYFRFNNDSSSNYSTTVLYGTGVSAGGYRWSNQSQMFFYNWNGNQGNAIFNIQNYSNTTTYKTVLAKTNNATNTTTACVGLWRSTANITELLIHSNDTFITGSTFNLYGIASGSLKATGGTVTTDGTYFYHTFDSSNIFTPSQALTADYLIVAGGGGGGANRGGGGAAGGYRTFTSQSFLANINYAVTIGAGGVGGNFTTGIQATSGATSTFNSNSATGGGRGGQNSYAPLTGGSGGGAGGTSTGNPSLAGAAGNAGSYSPVEGYAGGAGLDGLSGGGGGGSSAVGSAASGTTHPQSNAGAGTSSSIGGSAITYAQGGNGGGSNVNDVSGVAGTANRGNGGGGAANQNLSTTTGGNGGSGIVIVRYLV